MDTARADVPAYLSVPGGPEWVRGRAAIEDHGQAITLVPGTLERYSVWDEDQAARLSRRPDFLFSVAGVKSPHDAAAAARRYGLLSRGPDAADHREPFTNWQAVAERLRLVLELVSEIQAEDADRVAELVKPWQLENVEVVGPLAVGSLLVEWLVNDALKGASVREEIVAWSRVSQGGSHGRHGHWSFSPGHDDLAGYAFHRLAQTICDQVPVMTCANEPCSRAFIKEHGNQNRYCSKRCAETAKKRRSRQAASCD